MSSLERVPKSDDPRFENEKRKWMQEVLQALGSDMRKRMGDPRETLDVCCEQALHPEVYKLLRGLDAEDAQLLREAIAVLKGQKLRAEANEAPKDIEHMLADYRSARSIGKILRVVWVGLGVAFGAIFAIIKGLPDFLEILRGWLK